MAARSLANTSRAGLDGEVPMDGIGEIGQVGRSTAIVGQARRCFVFRNDKLGVGIQTRSTKQFMTALPMRNELRYYKPMVDNQASGNAFDALASAYIKAVRLKFVLTDVL